MLKRLKASATAAVLGGAFFVGMAAVVPGTAQAACTSFWVLDDGNSGATVFGHNYCSAGYFRPDLAFGRDPACQYMGVNGGTSWHVAPAYKGSVRSIVRC
jgi:hypothetical protein